MALVYYWFFLGCNPLVHRSFSSGMCSYGLQGKAWTRCVYNSFPRLTIDDEYANANERDPKILLITSRDPSVPLAQFVKELKFVFPNAQRMNSGGQVISEIIETCRSHDFTDVISVSENRGVPTGLSICHLPFGPIAFFSLHNVVTRHDIKDKKAIGTMSEAYPHLIIDSLNTKLGQRTANMLKNLFPVPKPDTKRIITFACKDDYISYRHHVYEKRGGPKSVELKEIGPRFEMALYKVTRDLRWERSYESYNEDTEVVRKMTSL